jgi:hypothetical protein
MTKYVAVVGPGDDATPPDVSIAAEVGRLLAQAGCIVVTGGLGGVMAGASGGCANAGGISLGLLPGTDRREAAHSITVTVPTGMGEGRNALVVRAADAVIAIGGSWGTMSELSLAMRAGLPVVAIGGWTVFDHNGREMDIPRADTAWAAVDAIL